MADVFISYSRTDAAFVRRLEDALRAGNRDTWVDWDDIPLTAEWLAEVYRGIEQADNFVFVLTPESIASATCQKEIAHAAANNKRIIPILHRAVNDGAVPETVGRLNWIYFRDSDDFGTTFAALLEALDTDLEWKQAHTRLLVRASEWERAGHEKSLLLRGKDLRDAEEWQARVVRDRLAPTPLHSSYILASRQIERKRQRWQLGAAALAIAVSTGLAVAAFLQRNTALRQAAIATSRQLAVQSTDLVDTKPDLALLLALEASAADDNFETRAALLTAVRTRPHLKAFLRAVGETPIGVQPIRIAAVAYSRDGGMIAAASGLSSNQIHVWNADTLHEVATLDRHTAPVTGIAFGADGRTLLSGGADQTLILWDLQTHQPLETFTDHKGSITSVSVSLDGKTAASADEANAVILWNLERRVKIGVIHSTSTRRISHVAFRDRDLMTVGPTGTEFDDEIAEFWDVTTLQRRGRPIGEHVLAFSPDGGLYAVVRYRKSAASTKGPSGEPAFAGPSDTTAAWLASADALQESFVTVVNAGSGIALMTERVSDNALVTAAHFSRGNAWFAFGVGSEVHLWKLGQRQVMEPLRQTDVADSVTFSPDGTTLAAACWDGSVTLWTVGGQGALSTEIAPGKGGVLAFSADGHTIAAATKEDVVLWDVQTGKQLKRYEVAGDGEPGSLQNLSFGPQGVILTVQGRGDSRLFGLREAGDFPEAFKQATATAFHPDGKAIAIGLASGDVMMWSPSNSQSQWQVHATNGGSVTALAFNHAGSMLAAGYSNGTIAFMAAASGDRAGPGFQAFDGDKAPKALAYRPDDKTLVATGDGALSLWDVTAGTRLNDLTIQDAAGAPAVAAFNPDASLLAWSTLALRDVTLVDPTARQQFGPPFHFLTGARDTYVTGLAFSPDGKVMATAYSHWVSSIADNVPDGIVLWNFDVSDWKREACAMANRNLTPAEWSRHLAPAPYRSTCTLPPERPRRQTPPSVVTPPPAAAPPPAVVAEAPSSVPRNPNAELAAMVPKRGSASAPSSSSPASLSPSICADATACGSECRNGSANACARLGDIQTKSRDYAGAAASFEKACNGGDAAGCDGLSFAYLGAQGVAANAERAAHFAERACDGGIASSCFRLAVMFSGGFGLPKDDVRAARVNQHGCDLGDAAACASLGEMYATGSGVARNEARAAIHLKTGCDGGVARACTSLGEQYASGTGVPRDEARAAALYRRACENRGLFAGDEGCRRLAAAYENGRGVDQDIAQAIVFYRRACSSSLGLVGSKEACEDLKRLETQPRRE